MRENCPSQYLGGIKLIHVAVDAMGGDHAPAAIVQGALLALQAEKNLRITLVGKEEDIQAELRKSQYPGDRVAILAAAEVVQNEDQPSMALRRKKDSSMMKAIALVKDGGAKAVISAGNTGALMAGGLFILGRIKGIDRPALAIMIPTRIGMPTVLLDVGATMDAKEENLIQYAHMGEVYSRRVLGNDKAGVALLNVGGEAGKGNDLVKKAYAGLKGQPNFLGNVEARDLMQGGAEVVVCEGFVGNMLLKAMEGTAAEIFYYMKQEVSSSWRGKMGGALLKPGLKSIKKRLDYTEYGGAPLLGVKGLVVKAHGSSNAMAIKNAIAGQAYRFVQQRCVEEITAFFES
jgi:phosphate acyltransferase